MLYSKLSDAIDIYSMSILYLAIYSLIIKANPLLAVIQCLTSQANIATIITAQSNCHNK